LHDLKVLKSQSNWVALASKFVKSIWLLPSSIGEKLVLFPMNINNFLKLFYLEIILCIIGITNSHESPVRPSGQKHLQFGPINAPL